MLTHGLLRVAAACPEVRVADVPFNVDRMLELLAQAEERGASLVVFPEMGLTGYTCHDLFHTRPLQRAAEVGLAKLLEQDFYRGLFAVGLPLVVNGQLFNCAAVIQGGVLLGLVPKAYLPNYKEFYDARYFSPAANNSSSEVTVAGRTAPFGTDLIFRCLNEPDFTLGVEICEDLWTPAPPSSKLALAGASVIANLSASNEIIGKSGYRRELVVCQSGRCVAGYVYASAGVGESSTDLVFGGHCLVAENGSLLAESKRFQTGSQLLFADLDLERLRHDRIQTNSFNDNRRGNLDESSITESEFELEPSPIERLERFVDAHPFVPQDPRTLKERCDEIFHTQIAALGKRLAHIGNRSVTIGVSGGLDSTLVGPATASGPSRCPASAPRPAPKATPIR